MYILLRLTKNIQRLIKNLQCKFGWETGWKLRPSNEPVNTPFCLMRLMLARKSRMYWQWRQRTVFTSSVACCRWPYGHSEKSAVSLSAAIRNCSLVRLDASTRQSSRPAIAVVFVVSRCKWASITCCDTTKLELWSSRSELHHSLEIGAADLFRWSLYYSLHNLITDIEQQI